MSETEVSGASLRDRALETASPEPLHVSALPGDDPLRSLAVKLAGVLDGVVGAIDAPRYGDDSIWDDLHGFHANGDGPLDRARAVIHEARKEGLIP